MAEKIPLSAALITKNEETNLRECLPGLHFAAQIVVLDSGSTDSTLEVAARFGCEIFSENWKGFGPQKQSAVDKCRHPWVLLLDADERIPAETASRIKKIALDPSISASGYTFPRKNYFQGRWIKHMGYWPDRILRLFRRTCGGMTPARVHEAVRVDGPVADLETPIEHYPADRLSLILAKIDRYSTLGALEENERGKRSSVPEAVFRSAAAFLQNYFLRFGFLDGSPGLTLSFTDAVNKFFKYAKLAELNRTRGLKKKSV
jgi:glycosyltransferase involved in cell wall biosynthesis